MAKRIILLIVAIILYRQVGPLANLVKNFPLNDFSVYIDGTKATLNGENPYKLKFFDRYNYSPAATLFFLPLAAAPTELSEWLFTVLSVVSLWLTISWTLKILDWEPGKSIRWLIFALSLKMFPVKLTLALGQINLIILALIVGSYYLSEVRKNAAFSGILLGLATVLKLTPAPILIYFLLRKKWNVIKWSAVTVTALTMAGGLIFGWDLTKYYFASVVPGLMNEVTRETINASYMNQSVTALMARIGIFGETNSLVRLSVSGGLFLSIFLSFREKSRNLVSARRGDFEFFCSLAVLSILVFPVFVWQHHFVFLLPLWIILLNKAAANQRLFCWLTVAISYGLLNFYFPDANWLSGKNPLIISHFLLTGLTILTLTITKSAKIKC